MITTVSELKELILWAKKQKVKSLKVGDAHFELSDLALIEDLTDISAAQPEASQSKDLSVPASSPRLPDGNQELDEFEATLFHSTR